VSPKRNAILMTHNEYSCEENWFGQCCCVGLVTMLKVRLFFGLFAFIGQKPIQFLFVGQEKGETSGKLGT